MTKKIKSLQDKLLDMQFLLRLPTLIRYKLNRIFHEKILFKVASKEKVFTSIWRNNYWGSGESLSGPGSTIEQTENIRRKMPGMFDEFRIKTVFDAPCGDMHWMKYMLEGANFTYLGGDIVSEIVSVNKSKYSTDEVGFIKFDITVDVFPAADVWLCRAVFYHLSNRDICRALEQFATSNIKYILTTNHVTDVAHVNTDITTGDWRLLNLKLPPFNLPREPLWEVNDYVAPHPAATLTLWTREQVEFILPALREIVQ